jgi:ATP-binding cassette subfamily B protein
LKRRLLVPEVVQTSNMDCGPAALKCLLAGFGVPVSYGRLREACQTGIDGTSIDTMETVAKQLGLDAEQILLPVDHLSMAEAKALPALVVVVLPNGLTHFVVVWRAHGRLLQVMDPAVGRRWVSRKRFEREIYRHTMPAEGAEWRKFAATPEFCAALRTRMREVGLGRAEQEKRLAEAAADESWRGFAALDASLRLVRLLAKGRTATRLLERLVARPELVPDRYWSVQPDEDEEDSVWVRGAVLVRVKGKLPAGATEELNGELKTAIEEAPLRPGRELTNALWESGPLAAILMTAAMVVAGGGTIVEAMLFRGLFDVTAELGLAGQRIGALAAVLLFGLGLLCLEWPVFVIAGRLGRQVENRLRVRFLEKIPKLNDRYFQSRLTSDMAERSHATKRLRHLPDQVRQFLRAVFELCFTAAAICWLEPVLAGFVWLIVAVVLLPAFTVQSVLAERDLRVRSHAAGLTRFYLDAMLGLFAIRAHGGERNVKQEHAKLLGEWAHAAFGMQRLAVALEALQLAATFGLVATLLLSHSFQGMEIGRVLLLVYWILNMPVLGQEIGTLMRQYPYYRNLTLRLLDPLGAPEESAPKREGSEMNEAPAIAFRGVVVEVSGHRILDGIELNIEAGSHVAIVGPSGAGKSSLVSLLLGWLKPAEGEVLVDNRLLNVEALRSSTAWVDPAVQLWNRSLLANVNYGAAAGGENIGEAIDQALLRGVLENLPEGMQTKLGEGGSLVSGGEGQRVRLARALLRPTVKLVILDEPFRGLDREKRRLLLERAREFWRGATLLCVTHDLSETQGFDQVVVIEGGRIVETGAPGDLSSNELSRYSQLLTAEHETRVGLWGGKHWRRVQVRSGRIVEDVTALEAGERQMEVA